VEVSGQLPLLRDGRLRNEAEHDIRCSLEGDEHSHEAGIVSDEVLTDEVANDANSESDSVDPNGARLQRGFRHVFSKMGYFDEFSCAAMACTSLVPMASMVSSTVSCEGVVPTKGLTPSSII